MKANYPIETRSSRKYGKKLIPALHLFCVKDIIGLDLNISWCKFEPAYKEYLLTYKTGIQISCLLWSQHRNSRLENAGGTRDADSRRPSQARGPAAVSRAPPTLWGDATGDILVRLLRWTFILSCNVSFSLLHNVNKENDTLVRKRYVSYTRRR